MSDGQASRKDRQSGVTRRQAVGAVGAVAVVAGGSVAMPAWATGANDRRLSVYEGAYAIDSHKVIDGYFATPRGKTNLDILVVIPGPDGIDDAVRDTVRRHALNGVLAIAPKVSGSLSTLKTRDAMIADFVANAPRLKGHSRGNGTVRIVAA